MIMLSSNNPCAAECFFLLFIHLKLDLIVEFPTSSEIFQFVENRYPEMIFLTYWPSITNYPADTKHLYTIYTMSVQRQDVGQTLYKCNTNVLCLLGIFPDSVAVNFVLN